MSNTIVNDRAKNLCLKLPHAYTFLKNLGRMETIFEGENVRKLGLK